jgi:hypothetical protein
MERVVSGKERKTESIIFSNWYYGKPPLCQYLSLPFTKQYACGAVMMEAFRI